MKTRIFLLASVAARVFGADFSVPANGNVPGGGPFPDDSTRYQQVYAASAFSSLAPVGGWITAIQFRLVGGSFSAGRHDINAQINFSTTARAIDGLSTVFSENIGIDERVAAGPAYFNFDNVCCGPLGVGSLIPFSTPFFYNPAAGNLLMDVRMFQGLGSGSNPFDPIQFDASTLPTDGASAVIASPRDSLTGTVGTFGLITGFRITPVPEPSLTALAIAAILAASFFGIHKKQPNRKE